VGDFLFAASANISLESAMNTNCESVDRQVTRNRKGSVIGLFVVLCAIACAAYLVVIFAERARRERDLKALQELGFGLQGYRNYHEGTLPAGSTLIKGHAADKGQSWMVHLLPYMERITVYEQVDLTKPWDHPSNAAVARMPYNYFGATYEVDETPYVGIAGSGKDAASRPMTDPSVGVFGYNRVTRTEDITDGAGNTIMVIEANKNRGHWMSGGEATVRGLDPTGKRYLGNDGQFGRDGGAMTLYADGSVRWINHSVDPKVLEALATIHGCETVPSEYRADPPQR
jgi:hypothetical protein